MGLYDKGGPYEVRLEAFDEAEFCMCGHTEKSPFCCGYHIDHPPAQPHYFEAEEDVTLHLCGCGKSNNKPFCDGSHQDHHEEQTNGDKPHSS
ncbi:MAG TPA: CDGSH iron-sulfur domain-containing protein [Candidatus Tenderia sp.]|nr:CDGSH iron-sulfur domain-containing protein [Candidatus Tenderia sp.]